MSISLKKEWRKKLDVFYYCMCNDNAVWTV